MIKTFNEIYNVPVVILMYPPGASGEFVACALSESIPAITRSTWHTENDHRYKYFDAFDRFLSTPSKFDPDNFVNGMNLYFAQTRSVGEINLALAHPSTSGVTQLEFEKYFSSFPLLQITVKNKKSKEFAAHASQLKIFNTEKRSSFVNTSTWITPSKFKNYLSVEWEDLFLNNTDQSFKMIEDFLNTTGSLQTFKMMINVYLSNNKLILDKINN